LQFLIDVSLIVIGLVLLYYGANLLVRGSEILGRKFGLSTLVTGITIVAFGTSAPELAITLDAILTGNNDIALANILGSNLANIGLVLGVVSFCGAVKFHRSMVLVDVRFMMGAFLLLAFFLVDISLSRLEGSILFLGLVGYIAYRILDKDSDEGEILDQVPEKSASVIKCLILIITGALMLAIGGDTLVKGASTLAIDLGVSQSVIGFTVVAIGSSLPEIATSAYAAKIGRGGLALGNVIGSNIWNSLGVMGFSAIILPIVGWDIAQHMSIAMVVAGIILWLLIKTGKSINRTQGIFLLLGYVAYQVFFLGL